MQRYCTELTERLLKSLDKEYNVVDMGAVVDVITALEKTTITKEVLEITRLGKYINELRRKTNNDALAKRAKDLVRRWRDMVLPSAHSTPQPTPADTAPPALNGAKPHSPALRCFKPQSPAVRCLKPQSPLLRDATPLRVISPALSVHSDHSRSPNAASNKQSITLTSNHRISSDVPPTHSSSSQNHLIEAVPRTHSSNKRLRKDVCKDQHNYQEHESDSITECEPFVKRQRLNGENISGNLNSQVPSPTLKERISHHFVESSTNPDDSGPKKRGRKKGSKSIKKQPYIEDRVKEKLASISRNPKLKTTQELLADLQARGSNSSINSNALPSQSVEPPSMEDVLRSNNEQVSKFLRCTPNNTSHKSTVSETSLQNRLKSTENCCEISSKCQETSAVYEESPSTQNQPQSHQDLSVEEILAKLPPLDPSSIDWSDCETEPNEDQNGTVYPPQEVTTEDLERLHTQCIEGLNGNYQPKLLSLTSNNETSEKEEGVSELNVMNCEHSQTGEEFREWHQMLARPSCDGQILHILPYVIID
ncbi:mediator of RNA polymerase II transcription subunit 26 isoform X1 [Vespa velutina]|uniref:mediator of RNA polymerase II transcription subunit 26 isoform X1 n=2 Tax=Vespa velutina TaxID=202808 RepID=UPI001FB5149A|nr:mediator of RNA polymerase II transcription subunit 26 isoform X1 [Vespa velutina]